MAIVPFVTRKGALTFEKIVKRFAILVTSIHLDAHSTYESEKHNGDSEVILGRGGTKQSLPMAPLVAPQGEFPIMVRK